jgi:hypothetical protein
MDFKKKLDLKNDLGEKKRICLITIFIFINLMG